MQAIALCLSRYTILYVRLALGLTFLAAVTDRFGLWGPPGTSNVAWGNFDTFLAYTAQLNPSLPTAWIPTLGWIVTLAEVACGLALIVGFQTRRVAVVSGLLLLAFALGMIRGAGIKAPLSYSVFSASAGALLLATSAHNPVSIDRLRAWQTRKRPRQLYSQHLLARGTRTPERRTPMRTMLWLLSFALALLPAVPAIAQQGVTDTEIVMGCSASFTGPGALAFLSEQFTKFGIDLYFRVVNEAGGIHGRNVRTIYYDDGFKPQEAVANTKKLVEQDKVFAVLAPVGTASVATTLEYLEQNRVPLLFPYQGSTVTRGLKYVVYGTVLYDRQARIMVDYLVTQRKFKTFGVIYQDDEYGKAFLVAFEKHLGRHGLKLAAAESVKRGAPDVSAQIAKLRAAKPQVTFLVLTPVPGAEALKERQKIGWTDTVMVSSGPLTDERWLALAGEAAEGTEGLSQWPNPIRSDLPGVKQYRDHMAKFFPKNEPNQYSLDGYVSAMLFTEAAKRAGRNLTRDSLMAALDSIKSFETGVVPPITIGSDHEPLKQGFWVRMEKGRFTSLTDWLTSE